MGSYIRRLSIHRLCLSVGVLAALVTGCEQRVNRRKGGIVISDSIIDLGELHSTEALEHDFVLTNQTQRTLVMNRIRTSCGCGKVDVVPETVAPGKSALVKVNIDHPGIGRRQVRVEVGSKSALDETAVAFLRWTVVPVNRIMVRPALLLAHVDPFSGCLAFDNGVRSVTVDYFYEEPKDRIENLEVRAEQFSEEDRLLEAEIERKGTRLTETGLYREEFEVTVGDVPISELPPTGSTIRVEIRAGNPGIEPGLLRLVVDRPRAVVLRPGSLFLGVVDKDAIVRAEAKIVLFNGERLPENCSVAIVEVPAWVSATIAKHRDGDSVLSVSTIPGRYPGKGVLSGIIRLSVVASTMEEICVVRLAGRIRG